MNCSNEETKWNWKWARRRQTKWKGRPEISAPRLLNPCCLEGAKWDNVILSVPDPEKSRPVAPPRRKRKRPLNPNSTAYHGSFPDFLQQARCLDLGTDTSMSLSSLDPLGPRTPRTPRATLGPRRRLSSDFSDCDCSISSRTSLASIPVTDELYRKHHFLSISGSSFNMTQASLLSASTCSFKRTQNLKYTLKRRSTLQNITRKYHLTLSLPNLNLFSKLSSKPSRDFTSLPDLRCNDVSKEAIMYAVMYGIKNELVENSRGKVSLKGLRPRPRRDSEGARRGFLSRPTSQMSVSRFGSNLTGTFLDRSAICEDQEESLVDGQHVRDFYAHEHMQWHRSRNSSLCERTGPQSDQVLENETILDDNKILSSADKVWSTNNDLSNKSLGDEPSPSEELTSARFDPVENSMRSMAITTGAGKPQVPSVSKPATLQTDLRVENGLYDNFLHDSENISAHDLKHCTNQIKGVLCFDYSNKENLDTNLLLKYRNMKKSPRYLKTFRRLSQRQTERVGCPLFFDKHHSCTCLRPKVKGQRFQSMSALPNAKPNFRNGLKKSLSVNHAQPIWKTSRCDVTQNCCGRMNLHDKNNNYSRTSSLHFQNNFVTLPNEQSCVIPTQESNCGVKERILLNSLVPSGVESVQEGHNCCVYASRQADVEAPLVREIMVYQRSIPVPNYTDSMTSTGDRNLHALDNLGQCDADTSTILIDPSAPKKQQHEITAKNLSAGDLNKFLGDESRIMNISRAIFTEQGPRAALKSGLKQVMDGVTCDDSVVDMVDSDKGEPLLDAVVKIDVTSRSRSSSNSGSLCELEDAIYDMLVVASNQQPAQVKN